MGHLWLNMDGWGIYGSNGWGSYGKVSYFWGGDMLKKTNTGLECMSSGVNDSVAPGLSCTTSSYLSIIIGSL